MRRLLVALTLVLAVALAAAALLADTAPGWTYAAPTAAPAPSTPRAVRRVGGRVRRAPASAAPSAAPSDGGAGSASRPDLRAGHRVRADRGQRPRGRAVHDPLRQQGRRCPHNVAIKDASGGQRVQGRALHRRRRVGLPGAGAGGRRPTQFVCTVHPNMVGTLKVGS